MFDGAAEKICMPHVHGPTLKCQIAYLCRHKHWAFFYYSATSKFFSKQMFFSHAFSQYLYLVSNILTLGML